MEFVCDTQNLAAIELFGRFSLQYCVIDTGYFVIIYILMFLLSSKFNLSASSRWKLSSNNLWSKLQNLQLNCFYRENEHFQRFMT